jgi:hypothetical protein
VCPVYTITLYEDGAVEYEGRRNAPLGRRWRKIDPANVALLMDQAERLPAWTCDPNRIITDQPGAIITVSRHGETRRIVYDHGDPCAPESVLWLETYLDLDAGTAYFMNGD